MTDLPKGRVEFSDPSQSYFCFNLAHHQLVAECERLRAALAVYADARHWAIRRNGTMYADCIWIGPGATDRVNPDGPCVARDALKDSRD